MARASLLSSTASRSRGSLPAVALLLLLTAIAQRLFTFTSFTPRAKGLTARTASRMAVAPPAGQTLFRANGVVLERQQVPENGAAERMVARRHLLKAVEPTKRGFNATSDARALVTEKIRELVAINPTEEPVFELGGAWTLLYSDAPEVLGIPTTPFGALGRLGQEIDADAGTITNIIEFKFSNLVSNVLSVLSEDAVAQRTIMDYKPTAKNQVELSIRGLGVAPNKLLGVELPEILKIDAVAPLGLPIARFEVVYLDEEIHIIKSVKGWYSVFRRDTDKL